LCVAAGGVTHEKNDFTTALFSLSALFCGMRVYSLLIFHDEMAKMKILGIKIPSKCVNTKWQIHPQTIKPINFTTIQPNCSCHCVSKFSIENAYLGSHTEMLIMEIYYVIFKRYVSPREREREGIVLCV
jgi:hypothetical protein